MSRTIDPNVPYLIDGKPVAGGYVYYGEANQDPKVNPIPIFSDINFTVPIANPQRTSSQGIVANRVYVDGDAYAEYSYLVEDSLFNQIVFEPLLNPLGYIPPVTENINMFGFTFDNAADATSNDQYATLGQNNLAYPITTVTDIASLPDAISVTLPVPLVSLLDGQQIIVQLRHGANTNVTPLTLKVEPFAPRQVYRDNNETVNVGDTIGLDHFAHFAYNTTLNKWELTNPSIQGIISNDVDMDGFKHINVADAVLSNQYATRGQNNYLYPQGVPSSVGSSPNAITADLNPAITSLVNGQQIIVRIGHGANTVGNPTLNINGLGASFINRGNGLALQVGDTAGGNYSCHFVFYNGSWLLMNPAVVPTSILTPALGTLAYQNSIDNTDVSSQTITYAMLRGNANTVNTYGNYSVHLSDFTELRAVSGGLQALQATTRTRAIGGETRSEIWVDRCFSGNSATGISIHEYYTWGENSGDDKGDARTNRFILDNSPPWNMGNGDIAMFMYLSMNADNILYGSSFSTTPIWGYNGKTSINPDKVEKVKGGKPRKLKRVRKGNPPPKITEGGDPTEYLEWIKHADTEYVEIDQAMKNADMDDIPHPFIDKKPGDTIIMIDPTSSMADDFGLMQDSGEDVHELFQNGYIDFEEVPSGIVIPRDVKMLRPKWKNKKQEK